MTSFIKALLILFWRSRLVREIPLALNPSWVSLPHPPSLPPLVTLHFQWCLIQLVWMGSHSLHFLFLSVLCFFAIKKKRRAIANLLPLELHKSMNFALVSGLSVLSNLSSRALKCCTLKPLGSMIHYSGDT